MEINRIKGHIIALTSRLDVLKKDVQLSPSEIKEMEVFEVRTCLVIIILYKMILSLLICSSYMQ